MNWRALLQNQWFQLCLLVAVLSGGITIYNLTQKSSSSDNGTAYVSPTPQPLAPANVPTPGPSAPANVPRRAITKIKPKTRGQWILDASGARGADSNDIETVAASLSDGDVVNFGRELTPAVAKLPSARVSLDRPRERVPRQFAG